MPYIKLKEREDESIPGNPGSLNYQITNLCHLYIESKGVNYSNLNEVIGALECAKLEFYRQVLSPYEDIKKKENGSVSILDSHS